MSVKPVYWRRALTCLFLIVTAKSLLLSQGREKRVSPLAASDTQVFELTRRSVGVAILVGVDKYPKFSGFGALQYPARDVDLLDKELTAQNYRVIPVTDGDATRESVLNAIAQAGEAVDPNHSSIIFFFSGHGYAQGDENMLATSDASANKLAQTGLALSEVEKALIATKAPRRMMWIDACRNQPGKGVGDARSFAKFEASSGTRVLFSTKFGHVSYEDDEFRQGVFSHYLVEGLHGAAARDDGWVSFRDLADYVEDQVQTRTMRQGHTQVPFEGTGQADANGDFPVAHLKNNSLPVIEPPFQKITDTPKPLPNVPVSQRRIDAQAQYEKAKELYEKREFGAAVPLLRQAAEGGHVEAMDKLGDALHHGQGVARDDVEAMQWYRKSAENGNPGAMEEVGFLYHNGLGVPMDFQLAMQWYRKAADAGDAAAMNNIGFLYNHGVGVPQDYSLAFQWFERAANAGSATACSALGLMYEEGRGTHRSVARAIEWYRKGAAAGNKRSMERLRALGQ